jgi:D-alanine-D-alanine ligase
MKQKIVILHNEILTDHPDQMDVIHQRDLVIAACERLNFDVNCLTVGPDLMADIEKVKAENPQVVFNLVEDLWSLGELIYVVPAMLNAYKLPYTGVPLDALFTTTNKVLAKKWMKFHGLPTADFFAMDELDKLNKNKTYIAKPIWEEASVGITADFIFKPGEKDKFEKIKRLPATHYFVEEFIDGREFNVSLLTNNGKVEVLPPAEMIFSTYFDDKPKIVGYKAKWDDQSEEYKQTNRTFETLQHEDPLRKNLISVCVDSWKAFNLKGYVRIDFRVDAHNNIYILEINGNPCISPDSGFVAAIQEVGYTIDSVIERILADLN